MLNHLLFILFLLLPIMNFAQDVNNFLSKIPPQDKQQLENFFHIIMHSNSGCYTLFGDKPVTLSGDFILTSCNNVLAGARCGGIFWKYWKTWEKYKSQLTIKNYIFFAEPSITCKNVVNVILINKKAFVKEVNQYIEFFNEKLGDISSAETFLKKIEEQKRFASMIRNDEMLWGILLGYGLENASLYARRDRIERFINAEELPKIPENVPKPHRFSSIEDEYKFLDSKLQFFGDHSYSPFIINSISFVADLDHPETQFLKKKYHSFRSEISEIYSKGDFLEITLTQLLSE
jgi:hypothetical protein